MSLKVYKAVKKPITKKAPGTYCFAICFTALFSVSACSAKNDATVKTSVQASATQSAKPLSIEGDWSSGCVSPPELESERNRALYSDYESMSVRALFYAKHSYWIWGRFFKSRDCNPRTQGNSYNEYGDYSISKLADTIDSFYQIDFKTRADSTTHNIFQLTSDGRLHFGKGDLLSETRPTEIDTDLAFTKESAAKIQEKCAMFNGTWWGGDGHLRVNQKYCSQLEFIYTTYEESTKPDPKGTHVLFNMDGEFYQDQDKDGRPLYRMARYTDDGDAIRVTQYYDTNGEVSLIDERYITFTKHPCNLFNPNGSHYLTWSDFTGWGSCSYWMRYP